MPDRKRRGADFVIVGAGSAGCVLANTLSDDPDRHVVLIEAGGPDDDPMLLDPTSWPLLMGSRFDWAYETEPQQGLDGRRLPYPRGKGLGGSSSINALGHQRGHPAIYDAWAAGGCAGWGFSDLLPYFKASERFDGGADAFRGGEGPIAVIRPGEGRRSALASAFIQAAREKGHPFNPDFNGASMEGVSWNQLAIEGGRRASAASAYLRTALGRPNLTVITGARVLALAFARERCVGVTVSVDGEVDTIAGGETLLCAGAIDSARLLLLAGIGDADTARQMGVEPRVDAPDVGRHLQDHPLCGVVYAAAKPLPRSVYNHGEAVLFAHSGLERNPVPDVQVMVVDAPFTTSETGPPPEHSYSLVPCLMSPESRGTVTLSSNDPCAAARVDPNYLATDLDVGRFVRAIELALDVGAGRALSPWNGGLAVPGPKAISRADRWAYARRAASPFFHPVGTCRMGSDARSVVDLDLCVRGVTGLRVIDASVIPIIPNAMPNAAITAIASKAADHILSRAPTSASASTPQ
jgi:choline dehydrogenase